MLNLTTLKLFKRSTCSSIILIKSKLMPFKQTCARFAALMSLIFLTAEFGCKKTDSITDQGPALEAPVKADDAVKVTATITGTVIDENNKPVAAAAVTSGTYAGTTDAMGNFILKDVSISKANGNVTVVKQGYFKGIRSFVTAAGKNNYVKIQLIKQVVTGTVTASTGGVINTLDGASITFPANAFVTPSGAAFTGTVFVYAKWIDPTAANLPLIIPGDLRGIDSSNGEYMLKSYGMVGAELQDNSGNILKLAPGKTATVSFPIPAALQATAPQSIPLWHFDEATARWKEEGSATKSGNNYIGQVNKFSFWNVDVPGNFVSLDMRLVNSANNLPLANTMVKITSLTTNSTAFGFTNDSGYVSGPVPKNQNLKMEVIAGTACATNTVLYTQNIGPYSSNTSLGNINITLPANQTINFTAALVNCSNQPVTNGYLSLVLANGNSTIAVTNAAGQVNISMPYCGGSTGYSYTGVDLSNGNYSTLATGTAAGNTVNLGTITACGNTINTSGVYIAGSIDNNAVLWKDGVPFFLTNLSNTVSYPYAYGTATLIYNNEVYVLGEVDDSTVTGGYHSTIKVWKNGVATNFSSGTTDATGVSIDVYNGDVYVAGNETTNTIPESKVWKNGLATTLPKDTFDDIDVYRIKVINGDVYVCGSGRKYTPQSSNGSVTKPLLWKNGILNVLSNAGYSSYAYGIAFFNGDIYIAGTDNLNGQNITAVYWKNGVKTALANTGNYTSAAAYSIFADNSGVYCGGEMSLFNQGNSYTNAAYWKNNTPSLITNYNTPGKYGSIYDIFVKNNIVYSIGEFYQNPVYIYNYLYFQNNIPVPLTGFNSNQNVYISGIFVQ